MHRFLILSLLLALLAACGPNTPELPPTAGTTTTPLPASPNAVAAPATSTPNIPAPDVTPTTVASAPITPPPAAPQAAVIYQLPNDGSVQVIDTASGVGLALVDPTQPEQRIPWSAAPNGQTIALVSGRWDEKSGQIERASLWTVDVNGANPRKLLDLVTAPVDPQFADLLQTLTGERFQTLAWTPDSSTIVVASAHEGQPDLYAVAVDSSGIRRLTETPELEFQAAISPDGSAVAYGSASTFGTGGGWNNPQAWTQPLIGGERSGMIGAQPDAALAAVEVAGWVGTSVIALSYDQIANAATLWVGGQNVEPRVLHQSVGTIHWDLRQDLLVFVGSQQADQSVGSYLWSWRDGEATPTQLTAVEAVTQIALSPAGSEVALCTGADQQSLKIWNAELRDMGTAACDHMVWSAGGQIVTSGATSDATAHIVDLASAQAEQLPTGALPVGWNGATFYFFALRADGAGWQLYARAAGSDTALGNPVAGLPTNPRLITSDTPLPTPQPTSTPIPTVEPTSAPDPQPSPEPTPPPSAGLEDLRGQLASLIDGWAGEHAVSVTDLQTGQTIAVNGDSPKLAACTVKIAIMIAVAQDIEAGRYSENDVASLVQAAMGPSYTPPARELLHIVGDGDIGAGIRRVNEIMWSLGATKSILTHPPGYYWEEYGYASSHGTSENRLTTDDLNTILNKLYRGEALSPWATDYVLNSMTIAPDWMDVPLSSALPADAKLYHKIGQLYEPENTWNDAGIVVFERGGQRYAYVISYLGSYGATWQDSYTHETTLANVAWQHFSATYQ
ncbi:MAG: serine hydrolase [Chloroflexi bacterium]|nr:serine hydrolase [Chloroflexota bacterium]